VANRFTKHNKNAMIKRGFFILVMF